MALKRKTPTQFFYAHAGWSYSPTTETEEQGRIRRAEALASAEAAGTANGLRFVWTLDPEVTSADWLDDHENGGKCCDPWSTWCCVVRLDGRAVASLGGIDFGRDGTPDDPYARVVQAELALEALADLIAE